MGKGNRKHRDERETSKRLRNKRRAWKALAVALLAVTAWRVDVAFMGSRLNRNRWPAGLVSGSASDANVLLITLDTTRADRLGCYGYQGADTPNLDALASNGIRFDDAVSAVPITLPSHATILTGVNPPKHGVRHNGQYHLKPDRATLAEILQRSGRDTAAFVSAFVLDARFGLDRGFTAYDDDVGVTATPATTFAKPIYERSAKAVTDRAIAWLTSRKQSSPFFAWVHYFDPHAPRRPPPSFSKRFAGRLYDGEIAYMDSQIGRLLHSLKTANNAGNTLIVVVADHGESLGEHDEATHANLIYESTVHVPLILAYPGLFQGQYVVDDVVVSTADITPTILDLLGIKTGDDFDGQSLLAAYCDRNRMVYMETLAPYLDSGWSPLYGIRRHNDKYILAPTPEYYDLSVDPHESTNLYASAKEKKAARDTLIEALSSQMKRFPSLSETVASAHKLDPDARHKLESLGYVGTIAPSLEAGNELADPKEMMAVQHAIDEADGLATAGRTDEALAVISGVVREFPHDRKALVTLGKVYLHQDRRADAERTLRQAYAIHPNARVCILLAQLMLAELRVEDAAALLDEAEALDPMHGGIYLARGDLFAMQGRPQDAIASYQHAAKVDPYRTTREANARIARIREIMRQLENRPQ